MVINLTILWEAFHDHSITYCWEDSFLVLEKASQHAITGLGLNSQRSLDTCLLDMVQFCLFPVLAAGCEASHLCEKIDH